MGRLILNATQKIYQTATAPGNLAGPTQNEITVGTVDVIGAQGSEELFTITGFLAEPNEIDMPGFAGLDIPKFPGLQTFAQSSLQFYEDDTVQVIQSAFPVASSGYLIFCRYGVGVGLKSTLYQYQVGSNEPSQVGQEVASFTVNLSILARTVGVQAA